LTYINQEIEKEFSTAPKKFGENYASALGVARGWITSLIKHPEVFGELAKKKIKEAMG
jgi:hypothetical protein